VLGFLEFYGSGSKSKLEQFGVGPLKKNPESWFSSGSGL
jgi:hypothetical protein